MIPVIKSLYSSDVDDLDSFNPNPIDYFGFSLQIIAGPPNEQGSESFEVFVCSTKWFEDEMLRENQILNGRHYLFMSKYDSILLKKYLNNLMLNCKGNNWNECALKLSRYGQWEFEDYKPHIEK